MITLQISVNLGVAVPTAREVERDIARSVKVAAEHVRMTWMGAVSGTMLPGMTRAVNDPAYLRSLSLPLAVRRSDQYAYTVTADYQAVTRIELGYPSYDMKPILLGGPHAKRTKDGRRYNVIPFRFGTPQASGEDRPHFAGMTMPQYIYDIVRIGGAVGAGDRTGIRTKIHELWDSLGNPTGTNAEALLRGLAGPMTAPYTWKSGQYAGMRGYGAQGQRQYFTFRTVSDANLRWRRVMRADGKITSIQVATKGSDPNSWMHPGQPANPVMRAVVEESRPVVTGFLERAVATATGG